MLLVIDAGNSQTHIGIFDGEKLLAQWRISTEPRRTADELALAIQQFLSFEDLSFSNDVTGVAIASVVPPVTVALEQMVTKYFAFQPVIVGPGTRSGLPILTDNPKEVGADRVVNSLAAFSLFGGPLVVVDFGTATTFDAISQAGEYLGGAICPGIQVSAAALWNAAALLPRVELVSPKSIIGKSTTESLRAGVVLGAAAMVDGMASRMQAELPGARTVATGGLAALVVSHCKTEITCEPTLTLTGLRILHERNTHDRFASQGQDKPAKAAH
ncbi:MAG: type III pantothenate kinase [Actinomycetota bacterium]